MEPKLLKSMAAIIDYLHDDELTDFEAMGRPAKHVYRDIERVRRWLIREIIATSAPASSDAAE